MTKRNQTNIVRTSKNKGKHNISMKKYVRDLMFGLAERKIWVNTNPTNTISSAGTIINLSSQVVLGDTFNTRDGRKLEVLSQDLRMFYSAVTNDSVGRFILFKDNMNLGSAIAVTDVLDTANFLSPYNEIQEYQQKRYTILSDMSLTSNLLGTHLRDIFKTFKRQYPIYYNSDGATTSANGKGATYLLVIGSDSLASYGYSWRLAYNDS